MKAEDVKLGMYVRKVSGQPFVDGFPHAMVTRKNLTAPDSFYLSTGTWMHASEIEPVDPGEILEAATVSEHRPSSIDEAWDDFPKPRHMRPESPELRTSDGGRSEYYDVPKGADTLNDLITHKNMNFQIGNIFKACYRYGEKLGADAAYDLRKIIFFARSELKRIGETE